jgi:hypothetical protein
MLKYNLMFVSNLFFYTNLQEIPLFSMNFLYLHFCFVLYFVKLVEGLLELIFAFEVLVDWSGDPCLPYPYNWDWIKCTSDAKPRVIAL